MFQEGKGETGKQTGLDGELHEISDSEALGRIEYYTDDRKELIYNRDRNFLFYTIGQKLYEQNYYTVRSEIMGLPRSQDSIETAQRSLGFWLDILKGIPVIQAIKAQRVDTGEIGHFTGVYLAHGLDWEEELEYLKEHDAASDDEIQEADSNFGLRGLLSRYLQEKSIAKSDVELEVVEKAKTIALEELKKIISENTENEDENEPSA